MYDSQKKTINSFIENLMTPEIQSVVDELISLDGISTFSHFPNLILVLISLALMWIGKIVFNLFVSYSLEHQLVKEDNKAIAISFFGYLAGVAIVLEGVLEGGSTSLAQEIVEVCIWGIIGILALNVAGKLNDHLILRQFQNKKELLEKHNVAVGVVVAGSYLGSAMIVRSIILGDSLGWLYDIVLIVLYFLLAQFAFFIYSVIYQVVTKYDYHKEIEDGNVAAGISLGFNLIAVGILLAIPLRTSFSLLNFLAWFIIGSAILAFFRFILDRAIIPLEKLDQEIHEDRNWGVAFLEGCFSIAAVIILQSIFMSV